MNGPRDFHTERGKLERERQIPHDITYMWSLKYDTNGLSKPEIVSHLKMNLGLPQGKRESNELGVWE